MLVSSSSAIPLVSAVKVAPSSRIPSINKIPIASSSTFAIWWDEEINSVVPPLLSVVIAVDLIYLSTNDWSDGIINNSWIALSILIKLILSDEDCHW